MRGMNGPEIEIVEQETEKAAAPTRAREKALAPRGVSEEESEDED